MSAMKFPGLICLAGLFLVCGCSKQGLDSQGAPKYAKLTTTDIVVGKGSRQVENGDTVWCDYKGTLRDGSVFDERMDQTKEPLVFQVGSGDVIKGWEQGVLGMKVGGERKLQIPAKLAFGAVGKGKVPPNADVDFQVKVLGIVKPGQENVIEVEDEKIGTGPAAVKGNTVTIQYVGSLLNGKVFEDSHSFTSPYQFTIGKLETLSCIDKGVRGMKVGGVRTIISPPQVAYVRNRPPSVPEGSEVVFKIELLAIK
jgi:FKBP-type peptidyl-prolyl cis-trans isomerase